MYFRRILIFATLLTHTMACPSSCNCKWKGGKQTVECVNKSMLRVPDGIDKGTQVLDVSGNNLKVLESDQFQRLELVHLQKIHLSRCRITQLDDRTFRGLSNLVELDLSNNILSRVPVEAFDDFPALMKLFLNGNPLKLIKSYSFKSLLYLTHLELSRCELEAIEYDAFYGLTNLEWLKLDHNALTHVPGENTLPRKLHGFDLRFNKWYCDCKLSDLYHWLNITSMPQTMEAICDGPIRLKGAPVKALDEQELACVPDVSPTSLYLEISEGKNVSLLCRVNAVPEAKVSWRFHGSILQNDSIVAPGLHLYYFMEEGTTVKKSELFIYNTNVDDNGTFVCVAENQAGMAQSNYTIRIVLKEEPVVNARKIPTEYVIGMCIMSTIIILIMLTCMVLCVIRLRVRKHRCLEEKNKDVVLYAAGNVRISSISREERPENGDIFRIEDDVKAVPVLPTVYLPYAASEQNPDLINDANKTADPKETSPPYRAWNQTLTDCFQPEHGLPKIPTHFAPVLPATAYYRTLPHRRPNSAVRYREAEFVHTVTTQPASYEHVHGDVRYNVEGYPKHTPSPHVSFSDTVQILGKSNESMNMVDDVQQPIEKSLTVKGISPDEGYVGECPDATEV